MHIGSMTTKYLLKQACKQNFKTHEKMNVVNKIKKKESDHEFTSNEIILETSLTKTFVQLHLRHSNPTNQPNK